MHARKTYDSDTVELLVVGDLASHRKGVDVIIDALGLAPGLDCRLTVAGGGRLLPELTRRARGDPRVHFTGSLLPTQIRDLHERADVLLFPTRSDVFGLVLVEAMGAGTAVAVSSAAGAAADLAVDGSNCILLTSHDPSAWIEAIKRLALDGDLRRNLGSAGARTVQKRWTIDHAADAMLAGLRLGVLVEGQGSDR
jgi:glycosyltransferase involved in cell wall biosynthesis